MSRKHALVVTALLLLLVLPAIGDEPEKVPLPLAFSEVIEVQGVPRDELYARAKIWFVSAFVDSKQVLEMEDEDGGLLVGKGSMHYEPKMLRQSPLRGEILFTIKVAVKDGRYRYEIGEFRHRADGTYLPGIGKIEPVSFGLITTNNEPPEVKTMYKKPKQKAWEEMRAMSTDAATKLIASLKAGMEKGSTGSEQW